MKTVTHLLLTIFLFSFITSQIRKQQYDNGQLKYQADIVNGMLNGKYISWYKNGKKKAEGIFKNNQRIGKWTVYDSLGKIRMTREYSNSFQFSTITSNSGNGESISLPDKMPYKLSRNKNGYYEYPELLEKDIVVSKRLWRTIEPNSENISLFEKNHFFDLIVKNVTETKKLTAFDTESDEFKKVIPIAKVQNIISKGTIDVVGYKIKEDWFYNSSWQLSETRIIGICPIIKEKSNEKQTDLFWIYYPELRPILASEQLIINGDTLISTLEDIFQFTHFSSSIYKESNVYDRKLSDYRTGNAIIEESQKIEMNLIDLEHDIWINMTAKK